ncbi:MAG: putative protein tyrosine phosphatase [Gammaproteobacteria bacterium]
MKLLFLCSRNQWRSPTAERIFARLDGLQTRSRGVSKSAVQQLRVGDVEWSDVIFAMEYEHKERLLRDFAAAARGRRVHVLDIPDDYPFMDPELVKLLEASVPPYLT